MREEREPLWEDPALAHGGVWRIKCPKKETVSITIIYMQTCLLNFIIIFEYVLECLDNV
jgi:hypothetical protein